jgi:hypothetical protein
MDYVEHLVLTENPSVIEAVYSLFAELTEFLRFDLLVIHKS